MCVQGDDGVPGRDGLDGRPGEVGPSGEPVSIIIISSSYISFLHF